MILGNEKQDRTPESQISSAEASGDTPVDFIKRDYRLWLMALQRGWLWLLIVPPVVTIVAAVLLSLTIKPQYESSCALVRQDLKDPRQSGLPSGYIPLQTTVVLNMMRSRANLQETIRRLKLPLSPGQLFNSVEVKQASRNANYIFLNATTSKPDLSCKIANTLAEIFVEDYKRVIRENLLTTLSTLERNHSMLNKEIDALNERLQNLAREHRISSADTEINKLNLQIMDLEAAIRREEAQVNAYQSQLATLDATLQTTPEKVLVYEEKSTEGQVAMERARVELAQLRQRYTDENPIVQKQQETLLIMEKNMKSAANTESQSKAVYGKNLVYLNLQTDRLRLNGEFSACKGRLKEYQEKLQQLVHDRNALSLLQPEFKQINEQITQKKTLLTKLEDTKKELEMFLDRSFSDISIYEPAIPATQMQGRKLKKLSIAAFVLGLFLTAGVLLASEAMNLTVRSRADLRDALHLLPLGVIPKLESHSRSAFYSSMQNLVDNAQGRLGQLDRPLRVALAPLSPGDLDNGLLEEIMELLDLKDIRVLRIVCKTEVGSSEAKHLINDYLYGLTEELPAPDNHGTLYFMVDDMAFINPPSPARINHLQQTLKDCDMVLWDLFEYEYNPQFFLALCQDSDMTIVPLLFGKTNKFAIFNAVKELRDHHLRNLCAVLHGIDWKFYKIVG